ncbi:MAG: hypothetical protein ACR2GI_06205, partial [Thermomicrobiales bacterium]
MADRDKTNKHDVDKDVLTDALIEEVIEQVEAEGELSAAKTSPKSRARKAKPATSGNLAESERPPAKKRSPRRKKASRQAMALPVVITDETILLPHMSIPYPVEDDETARAIDCAMRRNPRFVLVLTER